MQLVSDQILNAQKGSSWIRRMFEAGIEMKKQFGADKVYDFSLGSPDLKPPVTVIDALRQLADEVDVVADRNPKLLYDIESLTDPYQNAHYRLLEAVPRMQIFPDRFVLDVETDDELLWLAIRELAGKMQRTLDYCRSVVEKRTPFEISQKKVDLNRI
jgi:hypothetical protein